MANKEKLEKNIFRSKLAKRMFLAFVFCALLPILVVFIMTFTQVTKHFHDLAQNNLKRTTKAHAMAIYEKLLLLESELKNTALYIRQGYEHHQIPHDLMKDDSDFSRFTSKYISTEDNSIIPLYSNCEHPPLISQTIRTALRSGKTVINTSGKSGKTSRVFMIMALYPDQIPGEMLVAEINISYLWGIGSNYNLPVNTEFCVVDENNHVLVTSFSPSDLSQVLDSTSQTLQLDNDHKKYLTSKWSLFLESRFHAPRWGIILAQEKAALQAPIKQFQRLFPLVILLSIWLVLLFTIGSIRKNLIPLQLLKKRTVQIAKGDFKGEVIVKSQDEFEELADSLNDMSSKLARQFDTLKAIEEISHTAFSHQGSSSIIYSLLYSLQENSLNISLYLVDQRGNAQVFLIPEKNQEIKPCPKPLKLTGEELDLLSSNSKNLFFTSDKGLPGFLSPMEKEGRASFALTPFFTAEKLAGFLAQGFRSGADLNDDDPGLRQRLADQLSIALSNAKLVEDLNSLNKGTLRALARAVDTKSSWTAGHSERVAKLAVQIGRNMGLSKLELEKLEQAGLLHDIGKIGVSAAILDKAGKLTEEEFGSIKQHPVLGVRILEPINTFGEIIPSILHHHEKFDGSGYPNGLKNFQIPLGARILTVADVYDALISDRPYRPGWEDERIFKLLQEEAGRHFDPEIVATFLNMGVVSDRPSTPPRSLAVAE